MFANLVAAHSGEVTPRLYSNTRRKWAATETTAASHQPCVDACPLSRRIPNHPHGNAMGRQFPILVYNSGTKALLEHQKRCSMDLWTFRSCPAPGGGRPIDRFIDDLGPEAENDLSAILEDLQVMERRLWNRPQFDVLHGKNYKGMGEIRFDGREPETYHIRLVRTPSPAIHLSAGVREEAKSQTRNG